VSSRTTVAWSVSATLKTEVLPRQAPNIAAWVLSDYSTGSLHPPDRAPNTNPQTTQTKLSNWRGTDSVFSRGASYDNALIDDQFALFKNELVKKRRPWKTVEQLELVTLEWVR